MKRHLALRVLFFFVGVVLFYAPFALLPRIVLFATDSPLLPDAHRLCLRMPIEWLLQPWMYPTMVGQPAYLFAPLVLPFVAFFVGPWFCGWLCPAGSFTELLGRLIPRRWKLRTAGRLNPTPIRYGVLVGSLLSPFLGSYICCSFCNFTSMQALVSAAAGDFTGLQSWASFTILTFVVWFVVLGLFWEGGRGWCALICPAGAVQGLFHALGAKLRTGRAVRLDASRCTGCGRCADACPALAIRRPGQVDLHACNVCRDCLHACPARALRYGTKSRGDGEAKTSVGDEGERSSVKASLHRRAEL